MSLSGMYVYIYIYIKDTFVHAYIHTCIHACLNPANSRLVRYPTTSGTEPSERNSEAGFATFVEGDLSWI